MFRLCLYDFLYFCHFPCASKVSFLHFVDDAATSEVESLLCLPHLSFSATPHFVQRKWWSAPRFLDGSYFLWPLAGFEMQGTLKTCSCLVIMWLTNACLFAYAIWRWMKTCQPYLRFSPTLKDFRKFMIFQGFNALKHIFLSVFGIKDVRHWHSSVMNKMRQWEDTSTKQNIDLTCFISDITELAVSFLKEKHAVFHKINRAIYHASKYVVSKRC